MPIDRETRRAFIAIAATLAVLLVIAVVFSGRPGDAIYDGPPMDAARLDTPEPAAPPAVDPPIIVEDDPTVVEEVIVEEMPADPSAVEEPGPPAAPEADDPAHPTVVAPEGEVPPDVDAAADPGVEPGAQPDPVGEPGTAVAPEAPEGEVGAGDAPPVEEVPPAAEPEPVVPDEAAAPADEAAAEPADAVALAGDPAAGEGLFRQCQACHQIGEGAQNRIGPLLTGVLDRPAASVEGFRYSAPMQAEADDGLVWTVENLRAYLADPRGFIPGTSMAFAGVRTEEALDDLIAYLATFE